MLSPDGARAVAKDAPYGVPGTARDIVFSTAPGGTEVFAAPVNATDTAFQSGIPQRLPFPPSAGVTNTAQSTADGQRFLIELPCNTQLSPGLGRFGARPVRVRSLMGHGIGNNRRLETLYNPGLAAVVADAPSPRRLRSVREFHSANDTEPERSAIWAAD